MSEDLSQFGGRYVTPVMAQNLYGVDVEGYWDFGCKLPFSLSQQQADSRRSILEGVGDYTHVPEYNGDEDIDLTKLWSRQEVVAAIGRTFPGFGQLSGSCVGAGGGNTEFTTCTLEVLLKGEPERIFLPCWMLTYGRSRFHMGDRNRGEGSLESAWAKAVVQDGVLPIASGLPHFHEEGGLLHCGRDIELQWSDGDSRPLIDHLSTSREHPIQNFEIARSADDVWNAIGALKTCGHGSMYGYNVVGKRDDNGEALGKRGPRWAHKETVLGRCTYKNNRYFKNVNQWFYQGACQVWIPWADMDWICRDGEVYVYHGLKGIPEERLTIDWMKLFS